MHQHAGSTCADLKWTNKVQVQFLKLRLLDQDQRGRKEMCGARKTGKSSSQAASLPYPESTISLIQRFYSHLPFHPPPQEETKANIEIKRKFPLPHQRGKLHCCRQSCSQTWRGKGLVRLHLPNRYAPGMQRQPSLAALKHTHWSSSTSASSPEVFSHSLLKSRLHQYTDQTVLPKYGKKRNQWYAG